MKKRVLSAALALMMVFTLLPVTALATVVAPLARASAVSPQPSTQAVVILSFDAPARTEYAVAFGTAQGDIGLPDTLAVIIEGNHGESAATVEDVAWNGDYEADHAGVYSLSAYAEGYALSEGVTWPSVTVTVLPAAQKTALEPVSEPTVKALQTVDILRFDALTRTEYAVAFGTAQGDIGLPDTLAVIIGSDAGESAATVENVTWTGDYNADQVGVYSLSAYAEGYTLPEGVTWPGVTVTVLPATQKPASASTAELLPQPSLHAVVIQSFDALMQAEYAVAFGTAQGDIDLPDTLAVIIGSDAGESAATVENVTWNGDYNADQAGVYSLSAYANGYALSEGVTWPSVTVTVLPETSETDAIDLLIAAIDALPEMDSGDVDMENEVAFAAWLAEQYAVYAAVPSLYEQLTRYADDIDAMERIGAERADKLTGLYTILFGVAVMAETSDNWTNYAATGYAGGSGTSADPWIISTPGQLAYLSQQANDVTDYGGKYFKLGANIDLSAHDWTPIGHDDRKFNGHFDGANYTIYGMRIVTASTINRSGKWLNAGFFGRTESGTTIKNVNIVGATIDVDQSAYNESMNVGGIGGFIPNNEVTNCSFSGTINACFTCSYVMGTSNIYVGGIVGRTSNNIDSYGSNFTNCAAFGSIAAYSPSVYECLMGGIGGETSWGSTRGKMYNCYANSALTDNTTTTNSSTKDLYFGGVVGYTNMWKESAQMYYRDPGKNGRAFGKIKSGLQQTAATHIDSDEAMKTAMIDGLSWNYSPYVNSGYPIPAALYDVTYSANGGSGSTTGKAAFGYPLTLPAAPARDGYTFTGWYTDLNSGTRYKAGEVYLRSTGITLHAHWSCNHVYDNACDATCNTCGEARSITHTAATDPAVPATCTTAGKTAGSHCSVCNIILAAQTDVAALGHSYGVPQYTWSNTSCTAERACTRSGCAQKETETVIAASQVTQNASCTLDELSTYTATFANSAFYTQTQTNVKTAGKLNHDYLASVTAPTCTERGYTTHTCSRCGDSNVDTYVNAKGHTSVTDAAVAATCTTAGKTAGSHCSVCGETLVAQTPVPAKGHTEVIDKAVAPACTATGLTAGSHCSVCKEVLIAQRTVAELGHTEVIDAAVAATCATTGKTAGSHCSVCGETLVAQKEIAAIGHDWGGWISNGNGTETCVCANDASHTQTKNSAYTVTLNANGGTVNSGNVAEYTFKTGAALPTDVTKNGYAFGGWYTSDSFTGNPATAITQTDIGSKTYYAKWTLDAPTVGLTADVSDVTYGESVILTATVRHTLTSGVNYGYEWYKDNNKISGATNALTLYDVSDSGRYTVKVAANVGGQTSATVESDAVSVTIRAAAHGKPGAPSLASKSYNSITVTAVNGQKYICLLAADNAPTAAAASWSAASGFANLSPNTAYKIYTYTPATDGNHAASAVSDALEVTTNKARITSVAAPKNTTLTDYYTLGEAAKAELPASAVCVSEDGKVTLLGVTWTAPQTYNARPGKTNDFGWSVSAPTNYTFAAGVVSSGSITVANKAATAVGITAADKETTFNGDAYDVLRMFTIPGTAGAASYSIVDGGSGAGTLSASTLTITKAGTIHIKVVTAANGNYAAGSAEATLTVHKGSVTIPTVAGKSYTGRLLTADITGSDADNSYIVTANDGGIGVGSYDVALELNKPDLYQWNDETSTAAKTLRFTISQATNEWEAALACPGFIYDGAKKLAPAARAKFGPVSFTYATVSNGQYAKLPENGVKDAGTYYIKAAVDGNTNYTGLTVGPVTVTVGKIKLTPSVASVIARAYNGGTDAVGTIALAAAQGYTIPAGEIPDASGTFTWTAKNAGTATVDVTNIALTNADVNENYELDAALLLDITAPDEAKISPKALDITARSLTYNGTTTYAVKNHTTGVGSETITLTYTLTDKDAGDYILDATGKGYALALSDGNYSVKSAQTLTIAPKPLTAPAKAVTYNGGANFTQEVNGVNGEKIAITYTANSKNAGGYAFSIAAGAGKYTASANRANYSVTGGETLTIDPLTARLTWSGGGESAYNGSVRSVTAAVTNKVEGDTVSVAVSGGAETNARANAYTATATGLTGDDAKNYKLPASPITTYTIKPKSISGATVTMGAGLTYNGSAQAKEVVKVTIDGLNATFSISNNQQTNAGDYTLTVTGSGNFTGMETAAWGIAKKALTITAKPQTITYGQSIVAGTGKVEVSDLVGGDRLDSVILEPSGSQVAGNKTIAPGAAVIKRGETTVTSNYSITYSTGKLTIAPAAMSPAVTGYDEPYDGAAHGISVTMDGAEIEYGAANGTYDMDSSPIYTNAGEYIVYYQVTKANYTTVTGSATVKIAPKALTADMIGSITVPTYDGEAQTPTPLVRWTPGGGNSLTLTAGEEKDFTFSYANNTNAALSPAAKNAPAVIITAVDGGNYSGNARKTFTIDPLTAELTWSGYSGLVYDGDDKTVTASVRNKAAGDGDVDFTLVYSDNIQKNAGDYTAAVTDLGNTNYALPAEPTLHFTIAKAPISFTVADNEYTYNAQRHTATVTQTEGQTPVIAENKFSVRYQSVGETAAVDKTDAGEYAVIVTLTDDNFRFADERDEDTRSHTQTEKLIIGKKPVTTQWKNLIHVYDGVAKNPVFVIDDGDVCSVDSGEVGVGLGANAKTAAGTYTVAASLTGNRAANYELTNPVGSLIIQKAPVMFAVSDNSVQHDGNGRLATVTATANGSLFTDFNVSYKNANGETVETPENAGSYDIYCTIKNPNYRHVDGADGTARKIGVLTIYKTTPPAVYTVGFDVGDGTAVPHMAPAQAGTERILPPCSNSDKVFMGWQYQGKLYQPGASLTQPEANITLHALWADRTYSVGGAVDENGTPLRNVVITLMLGSRQIGQTVTDVDGKYRFNDVLPGIYNLVARKDGVTQTILVVIKDTGVEDQTITMPGGKRSSVVEVTAGTPAVVVGNLENAFTPEDVQAADHTHVELKLTAEAKAADSGAAQEAIGRQDSAVGLYLALTLTKTVGGGTPEMLTSSPVLLTAVITLPSALQGKDWYTVYRVHGGALQTLTTTPNAEGEKIVVNGDKTALTVYAKNFSIYAVSGANRQIPEGATPVADESLVPTEVIKPTVPIDNPPAAVDFSMLTDSPGQSAVPTKPADRTEATQTDDAPATGVSTPTNSPVKPAVPAASTDSPEAMQTDDAPAADVPTSTDSPEDTLTDDASADGVDALPFVLGGGAALITLFLLILRRRRKKDEEGGGQLPRAS